MKVKNLICLERHDLNTYIESIDNFMIDVDGVLWDIHTKPIDGIPETFEKLHRLNKNVYIVSNNCAVGFQNLYTKLCQLIPNLPKENVINPTVTIISYLKSINFDKELLILGTAKMKEDFVNAGFKLASTGPDLLEEDVYNWLKELKDISNIGAAIFDVDLNMNYLKISKFFNCVNNKDVLYITASSEEKAKLGNLLFLGPGFYQSAISRLANRTPMGFGKPNEGMQNYLIQKLNGCNPSKCLFVGDILESDIHFAKKCGFKTLLVLTGVAKLDDLKDCSKDETPDFYIPSLGQLSNYL